MTASTPGEMVRETAVHVWSPRRDVTGARYSTEVSDALASLLDTADALREAIEGEHDGGAPCFVDCDGCEAVPAYDAARAAFLKALEGGE